MSATVANLVASIESEGKRVLCNGMVGDVRVLVCEVRELDEHPHTAIEVWMGDENWINGQVDVIAWQRRRDGGTTEITTAWGDTIMLWRRIGQTPRDLYNGEAIVA
jgi:hypothetical protein